MRCPDGSLRVIWILWCLLISVAGVAEAQEDLNPRYLAFEVRSQLLVTDTQAAAEAVVTWSENRGGYFVERSLNRVVLRLPSQYVPVFREEANEVADRVVSYNPSARDLRQELLRIEAGISSREESLEEVLRLIEGADVEATLALEREIGSLVQEIEELRGRQRMMRNDITFARITVFLSSQAAAIPDARPSSFDWINRVDMYRFLQEVGP